MLLFMLCVSINVTPCMFAVSVSTIYIMYTETDIIIMDGSFSGDLLSCVRYA